MTLYKYALPLVAAFGSLASAAHAAPLSYDCDTTPGHYSELKQVQSGPSYRVSGRIAANELATDKRWAPGANVTIESADGQNRAALRLMAPTRRAPLDVVLSITRAGKTETQTLGHVGLSEELAFVVTVAEGRARVEIGTMRGEAPIDIGAGASAAVVCSTGNFHFNDLELGEARH
jgi:hypothetical protein